MNPQKIAIFGVAGETIEFLTIEALKRGHAVTLIVPNLKDFTIRYINLNVFKGDVRKKEDVTKFAKGHDVVLCAHQTIQSNPLEHINVICSVIKGVKESAVSHLVFAVHPFGLPPDRKTETTDNDFKAVFKVQQDALKLFRRETELQWAYAYSIEPEPNETNETNKKIMLATPGEETRISVEEYAVAIFDEVEKTKTLDECDAC